MGPFRAISLLAFAAAFVHARPPTHAETAIDERATSGPSGTPSTATSSENCAALAASDTSTNYTDPDGVQYTVACKHDIAGGDLAARPADAFRDCFHICNTIPKCVGFSWLVDNGPGTCYLKSSQGSMLSPSAADVAQRVSPRPSEGGSTNNSNSAPSGDSSSNTASATPPASTRSCQSVLSSGNVDDYNVACGRDYAGNDISTQAAPSFADCAPLCDQIPGCVGWSYVRESQSGTCYFKSTVGSGSDHPGIDSGYRSIPKIPLSNPASPKSGTTNSTSDCSSVASTGTTYQGYTVQCKTDHNGGDSVNVAGSSFKDCFTKCDNKEGCIGFAFVGGNESGTCYLKSTLTDASNDSGVDFAYKGTGGGQTTSATRSSTAAMTTPSVDSSSRTTPTTSAAPITNAPPPSKPGSASSCPQAGSYDKSGRYSCNPAHHYPHAMMCRKSDDGCYYLTRRPGAPLPAPPGHHHNPPKPANTICPKPGDQDDRGRKSCDPARKHPVGQKCEEDDGCYFLVPDPQPVPAKATGTPTKPDPTIPVPTTDKSTPASTTTMETSAAPVSIPTDKPLPTGGAAGPAATAREGEVGCQLIKDSRKLRLKTIVEQGNSEMEGLWVEKSPGPSFSAWASTLTKATDDAADLLLHPNTGVFSWHGGCSFSGFGLSTPSWSGWGWFGRGSGSGRHSTVAPTHFSKNTMSHGFAVKDGDFLESAAPAFQKWVACKDADGKVRLQWSFTSVLDPLSWFGPDMEKCAYVKMQAQWA